MNSQFGEDGLIEAIFEKIGATNRWCFEVGAADGIWLSNTRKLIDSGWTGVLIEQDKAQYDLLVSNTTDSSFCIHDCIEPDSLDVLLSRVGAPEDLDFGCIDIDSYDYWVWEGMRRYKPRVVLIEFNGGNKNAGITPYVPGPHTQVIQAGVGVMKELAIEKGYLPIASTDVNLFCVLEGTWLGTK